MTTPIQDVDALLAMVPDPYGSFDVEIVASDAEALRRGIVALGEQLRLANIDAANEAAEANDLRAERDEARSILATTADRLNTALRESGCCEMIGDHMHGLAIRDGVVALYDKGSQWRKDRDALRRGIAALGAERDAATKDAAAWLDQRDAALRERDELRAKCARLERGIVALGEERDNLRIYGDLCEDHYDTGRFVVCPRCRVDEAAKDRDALRAENARLRSALEACGIPYHTPAQEPPVACHKCSDGFEVFTACSVFPGTCARCGVAVGFGTGVLISERTARAMREMRAAEAQEPTTPAHAREAREDTER